MAVLKAARSDGAAVIGLNDGTIAAMLLAAAHPELCRSLVLFTFERPHAGRRPADGIDRGGPQDAPGQRGDGRERGGVPRAEPLIRTPTLVLNRTGNRIVPVEQSRAAAAAIKGARFVELPGTDHTAFSEGIDSLVDEVEEFLTGARTGADPDRMLTTLLFTDMVEALAGAGEVLASSTVRDVLVGADVGFDDRQEHELKGVPGAWRLFAATPRNG